MAIVERRECDIFKTQADVRPVAVFVEIDGEATMVGETTDMSRRARDRLVRFIQRGLVPPMAKNGKQE